MLINHPPAHGPKFPPGTTSNGYCRMTPDQSSQLKARAEARRKRLVSHRAHGFQEAEDWDLDFWQSQTPEARLSALVAIREDVRKVEAARQGKTA